MSREEIKRKLAPWPAEEIREAMEEMKRSEDARKMDEMPRR